MAPENTVALTGPCRREGDDEDILCEGLKCTCDGSVRCNGEEDGREGEGTVEKLVVGTRAVMVVAIYAKLIGTKCAGSSLLLNYGNNSLWSIEPACN